MKFCEIYVRDIDRIPFKCGEKLPENGERNRRFNSVRRNLESWIVLK
jgi:hypothetical protein